MKEVAYADLQSLVGQEIGVSDWLEITQERVNQFAEATGDHQWIHVDVERANREIGGPIAHGYLTLALAPLVIAEVVEVDNVLAALNYGVNKVRFPAPVPVDSKVRMRATLAELEEIPGGAQITTELTFELEDGDKPVCVAETLARVYAVN